MSRGEMPVAACPSLAQVVDRLGAVRERIVAAGGSSPAVTLVAVTKGFPDAVVAITQQAGLSELGENYAQELVAKASAAGPGIRWHFLGSLQRRRTASLARHVSVWEAIDRPDAADAIAAKQPAASIFVQVNMTGDAAKHGCTPADAPALVAHCRRRSLDVRGLMTVGVADDAEATRRSFAALASLADGLGVAELSMGMSDDYEMAVAEGATTVRLGRALFGSRPSPASSPG